MSYPMSEHSLIQDQGVPAQPTERELRAQRRAAQAEAIRQINLERVEDHRQLLENLTDEYVAEFQAENGGEPVSPEVRSQMWESVRARMREPVLCSDPNVGIDRSQLSLGALMSPPSPPPRPVSGSIDAFPDKISSGGGNHPLC